MANRLDEPLISEEDRSALNIQTGDRFECSMLWKNDFQSFPQSSKNDLRKGYARKLSQAQVL